MTKRKKEKGQREKRNFWEKERTSKENREEETGYERKEKSMNRGESG